MINHYEIKNVNQEEVLFIYLELNQEFGMDFKNHHKYKDMKKQIKKIIEKEKFLGKKIVLVVGGVILGTLLFSNSFETNIPEPQYVFVDNEVISYNEIKDLPQVEENQEKEESKEETKDEVQEEIKEEEIKEDVKEENVSLNKPTTDQNTNNNNNNVTNTPTVSEPANKNESTNNSNNTNNKVETAPSEKQVTVYRSSGSVITLSLEEYLIGVVGAEMPASFSIEALKAQAVVSRTYALKKIESGGKLTDTVSTQRYKDNSELRKDWGSSFDTYYQKIKRAVSETKDLAIYYQGNYIDAVYHSTSNGKTQDSIYVWGNSIPYLKSVDSIWDKEASSYLRETSKDFNNVLNLLGIDIREDISFDILSRDNSGRVLEVKVGDKTFSGVEFRTLLGLRSADFDLVLENGILNITTRGYGHGVGMSQYGANGMAKQGYNYNQILKHYYTGISIY